MDKLTMNQTRAQLGQPCACRKLILPSSSLCSKQKRECRQQLPYKPRQSCLRHASVSETLTSQSPREDDAPEQSQEKFLDIAELLRGNPDDFVFEEDSDDEAVWAFESRFVRDEASSSGAQQPAANIKGALDPAQADILSAYSTEQGFKEVTAEQLQSELAGTRNGNGLVLVDVRSPEEYSQGHIPEASSIPLEALSASVRSGELDKDQQIAIVCRSGARSAQACVRLMRVFGFEHVVNVKGGTLAWADAGYRLSS